MPKIPQGKDFRLLDASVELDELAEHLRLIESDMERRKQEEQSKVATYLRNRGLTPFDPEWLDARQSYHERIDLLPRFFRGSFLVSVYAAYESIVTEIADLIRDRQSQEITIKDLRGDFLQQAKKYYQHILRFELCPHEETWVQIGMLRDLRHAYAHANGRLALLKRTQQQRIEGWMEQDRGISTHYDYIICEACTVDEIFRAVRGSLDSLIARYKDWENQQEQT